MTRDNSARVVVDGIYDTNENFESLDFALYNSDSFSVESQTQTNKQSVPGRDDGETVLSPVSGSRQFRLGGDTSFSSLNRGFGSSDVKNNVRTWVRQLESLVLPQQGLGWELSDEVRGETYSPVGSRGVLFDNVTWEYSPSDGNLIDWTVSGEFSEGVQNQDSPQDYIDGREVIDVTEDKIEVGNYSLDFSYVENRRVDRSVNLQGTDLIHQLEENDGDSPVLGTIDSGVETEVSFDGKVYKPDNFESEVRSFDTELQGEEAQLFDEFSGSVWTGTIASSDSTLNAGEPNRFDFSVTLEIGTVIG